MYEPEDFEKDTFAKLIQKIKNIKKEEVSEEFDEKFFRELKTVPQKPWSVRVKNCLNEKYGYLEDFLTYRSPKLVYAMSAAVIVIMLALIVIVFQPFKMDQKPQFTEEVTPPKDTIKVQPKDTSATKGIEKFEDQNLAHSQKYLQELLRDINEPKSFVPTEKMTMNRMQEILSSNSFNKTIDSLSKLNPVSRMDSIRLVKRLSESE